ncbi:MAG: hypothetical protein AAF196_17870 [Planctomycetota bacterium]
MKLHTTLPVALLTALFLGSTLSAQDESSRSQPATDDRIATLEAAVQDIGEALEVLRDRQDRLLNLIEQMSLRMQGRSSDESPEVQGQEAEGAGQIPTRRTAMTWVLRKREGANVFVGADNETDAYSGDTPITEALPILAIRRRDLPAPRDLDTSSDYRRWARGYVALTVPIKGTELTSLEAANQIVRRELGEQWRMAEFHDGWGWNFWARGNISDDSRFWVHINDQNANPWGR